VGVTGFDSMRRQHCDSYSIQRAHNIPGNLVLSLGNPMRGDDGIGSRIIERLKIHPQLPERVTLMDASILRPEFLLCMNSFRRILIIDAAEIGRCAGEWIRIEIKADEASPHLFNKYFSCHGLYLRDMILMGLILDLWPAFVELFAVQPAQYDWGADLSRQVRESVPLLCSEIIRRLHSPSIKSTPDKIT